MVTWTGVVDERVASVRVGFWSERVHTRMKTTLYSCWTHTVSGPTGTVNSYSSKNKDERWITEARPSMPEWWRTEARPSMPEFSKQKDNEMMKGVWFGSHINVCVMVQLWQNEGLRLRREPLVAIGYNAWSQNLENHFIYSIDEYHSKIYTKTFYHMVNRKKIYRIGQKFQNCHEFLELLLQQMK